ncbi:MAG: site-specific DNA-methyltransferase, partial [Anaerolineae bacterium]|nr:site-specific DNA-methyltransferase [Anaerolineae bacterium]
MSEYILHTVDVFDFLTNYRGEPFHAVLTDPPYGVGIGKQKWDGENPAWQPEFWRALMPHLLPNALVFAFGSARTYHYLASAAESGGFIIHNMMAFAYSNGLLKGASITQDNANEWWGYRYSVNPLKPAVEPILVCSKPPERSARYSIQRYGAGALNIKRAAIPSATPV